jgi:hypothetical protein
MDPSLLFAHRLRHAAAALVAEAPVMRGAGLGSEFLLIQADSPADFPRIDEFRPFHDEAIKNGDIHAKRMDRASPALPCDGAGPAADP